MSADYRFNKLRSDVCHPDPPPLPGILPAVLANGFLHLSGEGPRWGSELRYVGRVGATLTIEEGVEAAKLAALNLLFAAQRELGSLERVFRTVEVFGMVRGAADFDQHPRVIDGCSEVFLKVFGKDIGGHTRCAVGASDLPFGIAVEIKAVLQV
jgi:enamine deaminase RidA (YjgF/YER057c/UK114 family)